MSWFKNLWDRWFPWNYDERNPARRFCKHCGQQQDFFVMAFAEGDVPIGWEDIMPVRTPSPKCEH